MSNTSQVVKVGIFMAICLVLLGWLILRVEDWKLWGSAGTRVDALFDSVVGLDDKAAVRLAGVRVGRVDGIRLEGRKARVSLLLDQDDSVRRRQLRGDRESGSAGRQVHRAPARAGGRAASASRSGPARQDADFVRRCHGEGRRRSATSIQSFMGGGPGGGEGGAGAARVAPGESRRSSRAPSRPPTSCAR